MLRLILLFILFFVLYKIIKFVIKMYSSVNDAKKQFNNFAKRQKANQPEEVEYTEVESELHKPGK